MISLARGIVCKISAPGALIFKPSVIKIPSRSLSFTYRNKLEMEKVYLRTDARCEDVHISFHYVNEALKVDREFNFCRKMEEKIEAGLLRIRGNIEKEINKKSKKAKKKILVDNKDPDTTTPQLVAENDIAFKRCMNIIENVTFAQMLVDPQDLQLKVFDKTFEVAFNIPWVTNLVLPTSMLSGFAVYPSKMELENATKRFCKAEWFRARSPSGHIDNAVWERCGEGFYYLTSNADIGFHLKLVLTPGNSSGDFGPPAAVVSKVQVQAGPGPCPFEWRHKFTQTKLTNKSFRIVSYNILADLYADSDYSRTQLFPYCPAYALKMEYRKQLFVRELLGYNADVVCLQEVDKKIFDHDLQPIFADYHELYQGVFAQKGTSGEGLATFFRCNRYTLLDAISLNIGDNIQKLDIFKPLWEKIKTNESLAARICDRSTTLQLSLLKATDNSLLLVANTHLYFHPDADHIRLLQAGLSMLYVQHYYEKTKELYKVTSETNFAVVFCGDFNSVPECGIYRLMTTGFVDEDCIDWRSNTEEMIHNVSMRQNITFTSACGTPEYTNYTHLFAACLDYIFFQSNCLQLEQSVPLPGVEELQAHTALPSVVFPSDHLALVADLRFNSAY